MEARWRRRQRDLNLAWKDVALAGVNETSRIADRQIDAIPDVGRRLAGRGNRERTAAGAARRGHKWMRVCVVMEIHTPGERARR